MSSVKYNTLLFDIGEKLDELNNIERLTFMCRGKIAEGREDSINNARALYCELERQGYLGIDCLDVLIEMLEELEEWDLLEKVLEFKSTREEVKELEGRLEGEYDSILASAKWAAENMLGDISDEPRSRDLSDQVIKELSRRLQNDKEAWRNVREALPLTGLDHRAVTLERVLSFFPDTPVSLLKDMFDALQLLDLVELLDKPVNVKRLSLPFQRTLQEMRTLRKTDERPTTYHNKVALLIIYHPNVRGEIIEGLKKVFMDLNSDNDVTIIPGMRRKERKRREEKQRNILELRELREVQLRGLKKLRGPREMSERELKDMRDLDETKMTETVTLESLKRWIQNQESFTLFTVLDFAYVLAEYTFMMEKLESLSNKEKLILTSNDWMTPGKLPKTLLVSTDHLMTDFIPDAVCEIFNKRWQTLDLRSMMEEMKRTAPKPITKGIQITDDLSSIVQFKT